MINEILNLWRVYRHPQKSWKFPDGSSWLTEFDSSHHRLGIQTSISRAKTAWLKSQWRVRQAKLSQSDNFESTQASECAKFGEIILHNSAVLYSCPVFSIIFLNFLACVCIFRRLPAFFGIARNALSRRIKMHIFAPPPSSPWRAPPGQLQHRAKKKHLGNGTSAYSWLTLQDYLQNRISICMKASLWKHSLRR